jgi:hypothetical protein
MSTFATANNRLFAIADSQHLLATVEAYWSILEKFGATVADKKLITERLARAIVLNDEEEAAEDNSIAEMRPVVNELMGAFRGSASLIVYSQRQIDATALAELKVKGAFPESDVALEKFWKGMPKAIKKYSTALGHRGFAKDEQEKLVNLMNEFTKAMALRKRRKTTHTKTAAERDQVFRDLRWSTQCLRRIGRVALRSSPERTKFDRVAYVAPKSVKKPVDSAAVDRKTKAKGKKGSAKDKKEEVTQQAGAEAASTEAMAATNKGAPAQATA